jgi:chromosome segregation ATPase
MRKCSKVLVLALLLSVSVSLARNGKRKVVTLPELDQLSASLASPLAASLDGQLAQAQKNYQLSLASHKAANEGLSTLSAKMREVEAKIQEQQRIVREKDNRSLFYRWKSADLQKAEASLAAIVAEKAELDETAAAWNSKVRQAKAQMDDYTQAIQKTSLDKSQLPGKVEDELKGLKAQILAQGAEAKLSDVLDKVNSKLIDPNSMDTKLAVLEHAYDGTAIAAYLKQKMEGLVNSDQFCAAKDSCPKAANSPKIKLDNLFDSASHARTGNTGGGAAEDTHR